MSTLLEMLAREQISITPAFTGEPLRQGAQWMFCFEATVDDFFLQWAFFGDFAQGLSRKWDNTEGKELTHAQRQKAEAWKKEAYEKNRKAREESWGLLRSTIQTEWDSFSTIGESPYLTRKGLRGLYGCRLEPHPYGARTIVPALDALGVLWGYQRIYSQKLVLGDKFFRAGARKEGCFHTLGQIRAGEPVYLAEGIATAASIYEALDRKSPVLSCFDAGNLWYVAQGVRATYPELELIFCADSDRFPGKTGKISHAGEKAAREAAEAVGNARVVLVHFPNDLSRGTDFNDLHAECGLEEVEAQLTEKPQKEGLVKKKAPTEVRIVQILLDRYGPDLVREDKAIFRYEKTHWVELGPWALDQLHVELNQICGDALDSKKVASLYSTFFKRIPHVPKDVHLYVPNPKCANFLDGTLQVSRDEKTGVYCTSFREHRREDYLSWVVPVNYRCDRTLKNSRFEALLTEALQGEKDAPAMRRALAQMAGAMLLPAFPQMFFVHGVSGSRKSTLVLALSKLLHTSNMSACDPANMEGFQIEDMIGKLVNIHTDIDDHTPIPRGFLKRFEDNTPIQVNRKGKVVVKVRLPQLHIYCANELPPNFEGSGKAFQRRVTLLEFKNDLTNGTGDTVIKRYEDLIWAEGYEGLLNFALDGLADLVSAGGNFFQPHTSRETLVAWQASSDPLAQFLDAMAHGELDKGNQYKLEKSAKISAKDLWECFSDFQAKCHGNQKKTPHWLGKAMRRAGFAPYHGRSERGWCGIGTSIHPESDV